MKKLLYYRFTILTIIYFSTILNSVSAQGYYKFSDKISGDFSDNGKISVNLYGGLGIPIAYTYTGELEYCLKNRNASIGVSVIKQKYSRNTVFDFQGGSNLILDIYAKQTWYPTNGRLSLHGAFGMGVTLRELGPDQGTQFSYLVQGGIKYRLTNLIGLGTIIYYSIEPCAAFGVTFSL